MPNQEISLTNYDPNFAAIQRQQRLAELLSQQAQAPIDINSGGGVQAPINPLAVLAKGLQGYAGSYLDRKAQEKAGDLQKGYRSEFADALKNFYQAPGSPAQPAAPAMQTNINATAPSIPGAEAPVQNNVAATIPAQDAAAATGPHPTSASDQMQMAAKMLGTNNPYINQVAPGLFETAQKRQMAQQMFEGLDTANLPPQVAQVAKAYAAQGDLAGALKAIQSGTETKYSGGVAFQPGADGPKVVARASEWKPVDPASVGIDPRSMKPGTTIMQNSNGDRKVVNASDMASQGRFGQEVGLAQTKANITQGEGNSADPNIVANWAKNVHSGLATIKQVPAPLRNAVSNYLAGESDTKDSPEVASKMTRASSLITAPYTKMSQYQLTADAAPYIQRMAAAAKHPGSIGDADLLDSLVKLNTGGNAITEAQVGLITGSRSLSDTISVMKNKLQNGGSLSDDQRQTIVSLGKEIAGNYQKGFKPVYDKAVAQLKAANIPERYWTIPNINSIQELSGMNDGGSAHPQDQAAINWARSNPKDPRSAAILSANGVK